MKDSGMGVCGKHIAIANAGPVPGNPLPLLIHLRNGLAGTPCLKIPRLSLLTPGSWNGVSSVIHLFDYVFLKKESLCSEHEHKFPWKQPITTLIHHLCSFLELSHLLPVVLPPSRRQLGFCQGCWCWCLLHYYFTEALASFRLMRLERSWNKLLIALFLLQNSSLDT